MKHLATIILAFVALTVAAQDERPSLNDTIVVASPTNVTVTRAKNGAIGVEVNGKEGQANYRLKYNTEVTERDTTEWILTPPFLRKTLTGRWRWCIGGIYFNHLTASDSPAGTGLDSGFDFGISRLLGLKYNFGNSGLLFTTGLGFSAQMLSAKNPATRIDCQDRTAVYKPLAEGVSTFKQHLTWGSIDIPMEFTKRLGKSFGVSAGASLHFNQFCNIRYDYTLDGVHYNDFVHHNFKSIKMRPLTCEFTASAGWKFLALYAKYAPKSAFCDGYGPQFHTFSIGVKIMNF